jgi:hypothetical protein
MRPLTPQRLPRREAIKWMLAATATVSMLDIRSFGATTIRAKGYGSDPKLTQFYNPGDLWPLTLDPSQRRTAEALCDVIIPADDKSPAASTLHVVDFIDEWVSAPYEYQQSQREIILDGLSWLDQESGTRWKKSFADISEIQKQSICDDICHEPKAAPRFKRAAKFFAIFRNLSAGGFYSTPVGWKDIGYVGNVALMKFDGPSPEVLKHLGLI